MNNLIITFIAAVILISLALIGLAAGLLITGKSKLTKGCGRQPTKNGKKDSNCPVCGDKKKCEKDDPPPS